MAAPTSFYTATVADNTVKANGTPETASYRIQITTLTAANLVAQTVLINDLKAAIAALQLGTLQNDAIIQAGVTYSVLPAGDQLAQRENKFLCRYHDIVTNEKGRMSFPCADLSQLPNHSEFLDLTGGLGLDLKVAFDAIVVGPRVAANSVILDSVQFVGRNT